MIRQPPGRWSEKTASFLLFAHSPLLKNRFQGYNILRAVLLYTAQAGQWSIFLLCRINQIVFEVTVKKRGWTGNDLYRMPSVGDGWV